MGLHLLDPVEVLGVGCFRRRGLFVRDRTVVLWAGCARLFDVREARTKHTAIHHVCSFLPKGWIICSLLCVWMLAGYSLATLFCIGGSLTQLLGVGVLVLTIVTGQE